VFSVFSIMKDDRSELKLISACEDQVELAPQFWFLLPSHFLSPPKYDEEQL
jgi:hypothetical protein